MIRLTIFFSLLLCALDSASAGQKDLAEEVHTAANPVKPAVKKSADAEVEVPQPAPERISISPDPEPSAILPYGVSLTEFLELGMVPVEDLEQELAKPINPTSPGIAPVARGGKYYTVFTRMGRGRTGTSGAIIEQASQEEEQDEEEDDEEDESAETINLQ